jgi:hypothetical protein
VAPLPLELPRDAAAPGDPASRHGHATAVRRHVGREGLAGLSLPAESFAPPVEVPDLDLRGRPRLANAPTICAGDGWLALTSVLPSAERATELTQPVWPPRAATARNSAADQSRIAESVPPVIKVPPSGEKAAQTAPVWETSRGSAGPSAASRRRPAGK